MKTIRIKKNYRQEDDLDYLLHETKVEALKQALKVSTGDDVISISHELGSNSFEVTAVVL